jgi:peptidoglycan/xylan/chitin deacetylase (PgdA/CDA1 family)
VLFTKNFILNFILLWALALTSYTTLADTQSKTVGAPIRFLLTFDDGPSGGIKRNSTKKILNVLSHNPIQPGIKAIFFVQTRAARGGGTEVGRLLLRREQDEGHLLAFHTATPHHSNHRLLPPDQFELSLKNGIADMTEASGVVPTLVRPPFWNYDARTLNEYHRNGLQMLLTDLSANDGVIWGVNWSWHKHSNLLKQLTAARQKWLEGNLPVVDGETPIIVTFHDVNTYTARNIEVYLKILLQVADELDMPVATKPFYDNRSELERAAVARVVVDADTNIQLPSIWNWIWR